MSRTGITFIEFETAYKEIKEAGKSPTIKEIRNVLGKGSPNTIQRYLTEYKALQTPNSAPGIQIPQALLQALQTTLRDATEQTSQPLIDELGTSSENNELLARENEALETENEAIQAEVAKLRTVNEQLLNSIAELQGRERVNLEELNSLRNSNVEANLKAVKAEALFEEVSKINEFNKDLIQKQSKEIEELKLNNTKLEIRLDEKNNRLSEEQAKVKSLEISITGFQAELKETNQKLADVRVSDAKNAEIAKARTEQVNELLLRIQHGSSDTSNNVQSGAGAKRQRKGKEEDIKPPIEPEQKTTEKDPRQLEIDS